MDLPAASFAISVAATSGNPQTVTKLPSSSVAISVAETATAPDRRAMLAATVPFKISTAAILAPNVPPSAPPAPLTSRVQMLEWVYNTYPAPTITAGFPAIMTGTEHRAAWGRYMVEINGEDFTFKRNMVVHIESIGWEEPYDDAYANLVFPQCTIWDSLGTGDLANLKDEVIVRLWRIQPDGTTKDSVPEFEGHIESFDREGKKLKAQCLGVLHQVDEYVRAPALVSDPIDIGTAIAFQFNPSTRAALTMGQMPYVVTGITTRDRGAWDKGVLNYVNRILGRGILDDGRVYTIKKDYPAIPKLVLKDMTTEHWRVTAGTHGIVEQLHHEILSRMDVIYAEAEDEAGTKWRNGFPNDDGLSITFQPLWWKTGVHNLVEVGDGTLAESGSINPALHRHEFQFNLGQGVDRAEALRICTGEGVRSQDIGWFGTITLTIDPQQGSRRKIRAGHNIYLEYFEGVGQLFHISKVDLNDPMGRGEAVLTVDTRGRDASMIEDLIARKNDQANNPIKRLIVGKGSSLDNDRTIPWDTVGGSGWFPRQRKFDNIATIPVPRGAWVAVKVLAEEEGTIIKTEFHADQLCRYFLGFNDRPPKGALAQPLYQVFNPIDYPKNPFAVAAGTPPLGPWDTDPPLGQLVGWGQDAQGAGYYPSAQSKGSAATGEFRDEFVWEITHKDVPKSEKQPAAIWLVIFSPDTAFNGWGRIYRSGRVN